MADVVIVIIKFSFFYISLDDLNLHSRSQLYEEKKNPTSVSIFLEISQRIWMKFSMLPQPVGAHAELCTSNIQEHLLQACPIYEPLRKGIWSDHTSIALQTCFYKYMGRRLP